MLHTILLRCIIPPVKHENREIYHEAATTVVEKPLQMEWISVNLALTQDHKKWKQPNDVAFMSIEPWEKTNFHQNIEGTKGSYPELAALLKGSGESRITKIKSLNL